MKLFRHVALVCLTALIATVAFAQPCTVTLGMDWQHKGVSMLENRGIVFKNLSVAQAKDIVDRSKKVLNEGSKQQDSGGEYTLILTGETTCPGIMVVSPLILPKLTHPGSEAIFNQMTDFTKGHIDMSKKHLAKRGGKGPPWGD